MEYTGISNLEVMEAATNYCEFLGDLIAEVGGPPCARTGVLDFGSGIGTYARLARGRGYDVRCCELDHELRTKLATDGFTTCADLGELPDASLDFVFTLNVLEHIDDEGEVLRELHRTLRPGGRLLVYVPAFPILYGAMDRRVGHVRRYRRRGLLGVVRRAGFAVDQCRHADSLGFLGLLILRFNREATGDLDERAVTLYDRLLFPLSRLLDRITHPLFGKNLVLTATRPQ